MKRPDWPKFEKAMEKEMDRHLEIGTWELIECPEGMKPVGSKWVLKVKRDENGREVNHKGRVVAQGFSQIPGVDFQETSSPVVRLETLRILLTIAYFFHLLIHTMDVVAAYLNAELKEFVVMKQPPHFDDGTGRVCKLKRALYGLKQAGRAWNERLDESFRRFGFGRLDSDRCAYIRVDYRGIAIVAVHVDDTTLLAPTNVAMVELKAEIKGEFEVTDLGEIRHLVGLEVRYSEDGEEMYISQGQYIWKILERFDMAKCNSMTTPLDPNVKLTKSTTECTPKLKHFYQQILGSAQYAAVGTHFSIRFALQHLVQFASNPDQSHMTAAKRLLRYLAGTMDRGLTYRRGDSLELVGYSDADWAGNLADSIERCPLWQAGPLIRHSLTDRWAGVPAYAKPVATLYARTVYVT